MKSSITPSTERRLTMQYAYRCPECGPLDSDIRADALVCQVCGGKALRDWSFKVDTSFEPHYSPAFGTVVQSRRHAKDLAKAASAEAYLRTGMEADYQVVDVFDDEAFGITGDKAEEKKMRAAETRQRLTQDAAKTAADLRKAEEAREAKRLAKEADSVDA